MQPTLKDTQYVLSLDSLDLNFLGQYVEKKPEERKMLWSKPYLKSDPTFYKVKLVYKEFQDEDYCLEMYETYLCSLCNIDVPQTCYQQHIKSKMHQSYKVLTEKILKNVARQIKEDHNYNEHYDETDSYYCDICSKLVSLKQRQKHNKSNLHLKCTEKEKIVNTFLDMYSKTVETKNNSTFYSMNDNVSDYNSSIDSIELDAVDNSVQKINETTAVIPINNIGTKPTDIKYFQHDHESSSNSNESFVESNENITDFELYLREMRTKFNINYKIPSIEEDRVVIVTPKGYKESISIDSFHSYSKLMSITHCGLCNNFCWNEKEHRTTEAHVKSILQPVNDNFCREVPDSETILSNKKIHCLLCNIVFPADKSHEHQDPNHIKYNQKSDVEINENATPKITFCNVCGISISTVNYLEHTKGKRHMKQETLNILLHSKSQSGSSSLDTPGPEIKNAEINKNQTQVTIVEAKKVKKKTAKTFCESCHVHIDTHNFLSHIKGQKHKNQAKENTNNTIVPKPSGNAESETDQGTEKLENFCNVCRVFVPAGGMNIHCAGRIHRSNQTRNSQTSSGNIPTTSSSVIQVQSIKKKRTRTKNKKNKTVGVTVTITS